MSLPKKTPDELRLANSPSAPSGRGGDDGISDSITDILGESSGGGDTPPKPDADTPPKPDADTPPKPDADTPPKPDADTPPKPDADTPPKPDDSDGLVPSDILGTPKRTDGAAIDDDDDGTPIPTEITKDTKANHAFAALRAEAKKLKQDLQDKDSELERLRNNPTPDVEEVKELRAKINEYETTLGKYDLAATKDFKQRFDSRMEAAHQRGVSLLVRAGNSADDAKAFMGKLISASNDMTALQEILADQPFAVQGALLSTVTEFSDIAEERKNALEAWQETRAALDIESQRSAEIKLMEDVERDVGAAIENVRKAGNFLYAKSEDDEAWNAQVDTRIKAVQGLMRSAKPKELATWVMEGVTAKATRELFMAAHNKVQELQDKLQRYTAASPRIGGEVSQRGGSPQPSEAKPQEPMAVIEEIFGG